MVMFLCWQDAETSRKMTEAIVKVLAGLARGIGLDFSGDGAYLVVRKLGHFVAFLLLTMLGYCTIVADAKEPMLALAYFIALSATVAIVAETGQALIGDRYATTDDAVVNMTGAALGLMIGSRIKPLSLFH